MNISLFRDYHTSTETLTIDEFLQKVKYGEWKKQIEEVRTEEDTEKRLRLKKRLPGVTISGTFNKRKEAELLGHSGFLCIDIDHYTNKQGLLDDPHTYALFKSSSGGGLALVMRINGAKHKESFLWSQHYLHNTYGIVIDTAPSNVASLRYVSYDPELFLNTKSKLAGTKSIKVKKHKTLPIILDDSEVASLVKQVDTDIAPTYEEYYKLAFALADGFNETGRAYFHTLCSFSPKYDSRHADHQYDIALKGNKGGVTVGTFYHMLKEAGVVLPKQNKKLVHLATLGKKAERTQAGVVEQLVTLEGMDREKAEQFVGEVYKRDDLDVENINTPSEVVLTLIEWIGQKHPVRFNRITQKVEVEGIPLTNQRINSIYLDALVFFNSKEITQRLVENIIFSDMIPSYHPIEEYIEQNSYRRSVGNIDKIIKSIRTTTDMKEVFMRKWMLGLIAAYFGEPVRTVLVLVGGQGTGKTEFFRRLLPSKLMAYYGESKLDNGKDDELLMCQKLLLMDDEFGGKNKYDAKKFKEITSKSVFSLRAPYARVNEDYKRLAVLCGTSNDPEVINDPTGNTRILPVEVLSIDHELFNSVDKDELFIELYHAYMGGEEWRLTSDEVEYLRITGEDFEETKGEAEFLDEFFRRPEKGEEGEFLTASVIKDYLEEHTNQKFYFKKLGIELRKMFGNPHRKDFQRKFHVKKKRELDDNL